LALGNTDYAFAGEYAVYGCFAYPDTDIYANIAFFGTNESEDSSLDFGSSERYYRVLPANECFSHFGLVI
jgi:hypothetical protein